MLSETEELHVKAHIAELITDYWDEVDSRWGAAAHEFFLEDGTFLAMKGHREIKGFYDWRRSRGERVSLHLVNNLKVRIDGPDRVTARYVMVLYAVDGVPVLKAKLPASISEVVEIFVRTAAGQWKLESKSFKTLFKGDEPTTNMPDDVLAAIRAER